MSSLSTFHIVKLLNRFFAIFFLFPLLLHAEVQPKRYLAKELTSEIKFDGIPDDLGWKTASVADNFIQLEPTEGALITQNTEVRVLYDNTAVYVLAIMHDTHADSILQELGNRDEGYDLNSANFLGPDTRLLDSFGANYPYKMRFDFEIWRFVSPILLHAGFMHIFVS